jgi:hypothetical protein
MRLISADITAQEERVRGNSNEMIEIPQGTAESGSYRGSTVTATAVIALVHPRHFSTFYSETTSSCTFWKLAEVQSLLQRHI